MFLIKFNCLKPCLYSTRPHEREGARGKNDVIAVWAVARVGCARLFVTSRTAPHPKMNNFEPNLAEQACMSHCTGTQFVRLKLVSYIYKMSL